MHPDLRGALDAVSAPRRTACPSRQLAPFRVANQVTVPSGPFPSAITPVAPCRAEARSSTALLLVIAPLSVSRIQLCQVYRQCGCRTGEVCVSATGLVTSSDVVYDGV